MRDAFIKALIRLALADPKLLLLTGDHGYSLFDEFRKVCPNQYINAGIAEQNMVGMAAGLSRLGFRPFVYGLAAFVPVRVLEQIKLDVAHDSLPVVIVGDGAGFVYSYLGTSHQSTEDIACTRAIPNLTVLSPADHQEMTACIELAYNLHSPVYLRIGKSDRGNIHQMPLNCLQVGQLLQVRQGRKDMPTLIATGSMVKTAMDISDKHLDGAVWSVPSIKPLDIESVVAIARASRGLVVMEEHSILGGLGAAITEITSDFAPCRVIRIGVPDRFSLHCGSYEYLLDENDLGLETIRRRIDDFVTKL